MTQTLPSTKSNVRTLSEYEPVELADSVAAVIKTLVAKTNDKSVIPTWALEMAR